MRARTAMQAALLAGWSIVGLVLGTGAASLWQHAFRVQALAVSPLLLANHGPVALSLICSRKQCRGLSARPLVGTYVRLRAPFIARCVILRAHEASCPVPPWLHFSTAGGYVVRGEAQ